MPIPKSARTVPRPVGRPRAVRRPVPADVREEILDAAAGLFGAHGYTATSTRAIAAEVGLRQASLFHYFARKDDILSELLDRTLRPTLEGVGRHHLEDHAPDLALWLLARADVANLCRGPHNLGALQLLPEVQDPQFEWFWRRRRRLFRIYARQIARGVASGAFAEADRRTAANVVFGLVESVITADDSMRHRSTTPSVIADASLRICGVAPSRVRAIGRRAHRFGDW
jgi:AcrR family transcriptional regulator